MPKSAKLFRRSLQKSGVFFTPKKLAEYMRSFFPSDVAEIYDPTCGDGGLLAPLSLSLQSPWGFETARKRGHPHT